MTRRIFQADMSRNTLKCKKFLPLLPPSSEHIADPADAEKREIEKLQTKAKEIKSCGCGCGVGEKEKTEGVPEKLIKLRKMNPWIKDAQEEG